MKFGPRPKAGGSCPVFEASEMRSSELAERLAATETLIEQHSCKANRLADSTSTRMCYLPLQETEREAFRRYLVETWPASTNFAVSFLDIDLKALRVQTEVHVCLPESAGHLAGACSQVV